MGLHGIAKKSDMTGRLNNNSETEAEVTGKQKTTEMTTRCDYFSGCFQSNSLETVLLVGKKKKKKKKRNLKVLRRDF